MRAFNCKTSRYAIEEADLGREMSPEVLAHLRACRNCEDFFEERLKLRQLVASLETVAAPADFDFCLRARLADTKTEPRAFNSLRFVSMAVAALLLVAGIGFGLRLLTSRVQVSQIAADTSPVSSASPSEDAIAPAPLETGSAQPYKTPSSPSKQLVVRPNRSIATSQIRPRTVAKDFSNTPAPVLRQEESLASANEIHVFPIGANYESLNVSLDDGSGTPRIVSVPSVSFGSQRILTSELSPAGKETKGIW